MSSQKGSSKADTLVKVVLVFFISLLSFSVGTFVGKQVSDSDHRRMALEGEYKAERGVASADEHGAADGDKISEKEVESLTEEFVNKEKAAATVADAEESEAARGVAEKSGEATAASEGGYKSYSRGAAKPEAMAAHKAEAAAEAHAPRKPAAASDKAAQAAPAPAAAAAKAEQHAMKADAINQAAEKVAHDVAPTDGMKEEKKAPPQLPSVASSAVGKYTVQVASYADEKEAKEHAAGLKGKGWNAFYLPATVSGKTWFRVLVGLFNNDKSAKEFRAQFMKESNTKSAIVQKIVQ